MGLPAKRSRLKGLNNSQIKKHAQIPNYVPVLFTNRFGKMGHWESNTDIQTMPDKRMLFKNIRTL